ncbi:MAG TPA: amino acid adenylation domain-containing protein, partial [Ktedonobacteraceae bacterium]
MSDVGKRIAALSREKLEQLLQRIRQKKAQQSQGIVLRPRDMPAFPLSFAQQRLWFLDQWEPESPLYNIPLAIRLTGSLDVCSLEQALGTLMQRHESLRTTFLTRDAQPVQVISPSLPLALPLVNLEGISEVERAASVHHLAGEEAHRPFALSQGPLLRVRLLRLSTREHTLLVTIHHILADGWSLGIFVRELAVLYAAFATGQPSPLGNLSLQYMDYALWQREWLQGELLEEHLAYWKRQLKDAPPALDLPTDHPYPARQTFHGSRSAFRLPQSLAEALKRLSSQREATLFMTLLAAWQILLFRQSGREDILVGTPIANRTRRELEPIMGCFVNTLVLRGNLAGDPSFLEFLGRVRETTLDAYAHQDLPFERLVSELALERETSRNPLFQVMFTLQSTVVRELISANLVFGFGPTNPEVVVADLALSLWEGEDGISGSCEYNTDLFEEATIKRLIQHFQVLLGSIVADPEKRVSALPILTATDQQQLLVAWNATSQPLSPACFHQLFEEQARRSPCAIAVVAEEGMLSYEELNERANQLARYLQTLGVGPDVMVGLCLERSLNLMVGLLAILKAGGAYLSLDPTYPAERLAFMLRDARTRVLLTREHLRPLFPPEAAQARTVLCLETAREEIGAQAVLNPRCLILPQHLAYVIYTSGSTGAPKGAMITHEGLVNYLMWATKHYEVAESSGTLVHSSLSFDLTVTSLFTPLLVGRRVVLLSEGYGVEKLGAALVEEQTGSLVKVTPAHLGNLRSLFPVEQIARSVRTLIIGGEALETGQVAFWQKVAPHMRIYNEYGPTETTVGCSVYEVSVRNREQGSVPIGKPIANTSLYILDARARLVPIGVVGELYIGGAGLGRGYLGRSDLTAEGFIPHPFSQEPGARLYRTGDLARYLPDSSIEFLGRADEQIKLRGYRIEPGEIESMLQQHPAIREAVVLARSGQADEKRLVAYLVIAQKTMRLDDIRAWLEARLPHYMLPSDLVLLQRLPLTRNGKIDRRELIMLELQRHGEEGAMVAPRGPLEELVAETWGQVLGRERVSIHENFFALGGHSLLATQAVARLR